MSDNPYAAPASTAGHTLANSIEGRTISRVYPMQAGKIMAFVYGIMGAILAPFILLGTLFGENSEGAVFGIIFALLVPLFYAAMGFVGGIIGSAIYNFAAGIMGGIKVDID